MTDSLQAGPGAELKAAREAMEVSTREVADALNLPAHVIEALEADDHDRLPPSVFTRGYLRSYARLLELDPDPLLASYPEVTEEVDVVSVESELATGTLVTPKQIIGLAAGAGILLIFLLVWLLSGDEADEVPVSESGELTSEQAPVEPASEDEPGLDAGDSTRERPEELESEDIVPAGEPAEALIVAPPAAVAREERVPAERVPEEVVPEEPEASVDDRVIEASATRKIETPPNEPAVVVDEPLVPVSSSALRTDPGEVTESRLERRITEFGEDEITLVFAEDCWVEVKSIDGVNLYSDLNRVGRTLVLTGRGPFRLLLGYAPGVTLSFNGEVVPLGRHSRNNVANLVLGE